jgi:opacity protein-like surface antigen
LRNRECAGLPGKTRRLCLIAFLTLATSAVGASAQAVPAVSSYYARTNTFSVFGAYSGDSSHILLGDAENRRLLNIGVAYGRKLLVNRMVNWQYNGELLPVALESDPVALYTYSWTSPTVYSESGTAVLTTPCIPGSGSFSTTDNGKTYSYSYTFTCSRQWTIGEGMSPVGFQWNFRPRRKLQPFFIGHGGYMYSTQPIPVPQAGSFNFTFDLGAGFELYRSKTRSVRAEYRYHHISNHNTANQNPGIDNGLFQVTYSFGR